MTNKSLKKNIFDYDVFIFDMDGTLYFQLPVRICMAIEIFMYYFFRPHKYKDLLNLIRFRKSYERGLLLPMNSNIHNWMHVKPLKYIRKFRDRKLLDFIEKIQNLGKTIIVYSDYPLDEKLKALTEFNPNMKFCASDNEIQCLKPDTKGLQNIVKIFAKPIDEFIFIGDRYEKDGICAQNAGMDYIILNKFHFNRRYKFS